MIVATVSGDKDQKGTQKMKLLPCKGCGIVRAGFLI